MQSRSRRRVAILGSTGSIGCNALRVIEAWSEEFEVVALSAHQQLDALVEQARRFRPAKIIATDAEYASSYDWPKDLPVEIETGPDALQEIASSDDVDVVLAAIVGSAGMRSTLAAIEAGKRVALANKETLVVAGHLAMETAARTGAEILPVDSEHSAIFQALQGGQRQDLKQIILTASGGPFRTLSAEAMLKVTVDQALAHPTWEMGRKITIDSATMMNKALEIIEARWLFDLSADEIEVVVHPQSIVHSMVEFRDGAVVAQLSPPDMKLPIQYALSYPERSPGPAATMDWAQACTLQFEPPDHERFPALKLGLEVAHRGGTAGVVLNAANEVAVEKFLNRQIAFHQIVAGCRSVLDQHHFESRPSLETLMKLDGWARQEMEKWILV
jgi:1-deoxy-D-xylulose-5-phosphate reductoisomerase